MRGLSVEFRLRRVAPWLIVTLLLSLLLVSCQSQSSEPAVDTPLPPEATEAVAPTEEPEAPAETPEEIVIGGTLPFTGIYAAFGRFYIDAYNLWEQQINAKGGLLGRPVRMILYDDTSDAETAVSLYEKLITVDGVDFLVGGFPTPVILPTLAVADKHGMVLVQGGANALGPIRDGEFEYAFTTITGSTVWLNPLVDWLASMSEDERPPNMAIVQQVNPFFQDALQNAEPDYEELGIEVLFNESFSSNAQDFTPMVQKFKAEGVDFVLAANNYPAGITFLQAVCEQQYQPSLIYMVVGPTVYEWVEDLGECTDYVFTSTSYARSLEGAGNEEFAAAIEEEFGYVPTRDSGVAYTVLQVIEQAIEGAQSLDQDTVRDYLFANEFDTVTGKISFDEDGIADVVSHLLQVQDTEQLIVWPPSLAEADPIYPRPYDN